MPRGSCAVSTKVFALTGIFLDRLTLPNGTQIYKSLLTISDTKPNIFTESERKNTFNSIQK